MLKKETFEAALKEISKGYAEYQYFFSKLSSPQWLQPLAEKGFFKDPPNPVREGDYISFPPWPESGYLARMAKIALAQTDVVEIALKIRATENVSIHEDLFDISLALPPEIAIRFLPQAKQWLKSPYKLRLPYRISGLIVRLATGGQGKAAIDLAATALSLHPQIPSATGEISGREPRPLFQEWHYQQILDKAIPSLVETAGIATIKLLGDLLSSNFDLSHKEAEKGSEDYLYIWHGAIEQSKKLPHIPTALLCALRDAAQQIISRDSSQFTTVFADFKARKWTSFRRLELHLCRIFPDLGIAEAAELFRDPEILEHSSTRHEAVLLLKTVFSRFPKATQEALLGWIESGPDKESLRERVGDKVTEQEINDYCDRWRRDRLAILEGQLPEKLAARLDEFKEKLGAPHPLDAINKVTSWMGPTSPKSSDDLADLQPAQVINYLRDWQPSNNPMEATREGLGRTLTNVVSNHAAEYAQAATAFRDIDPTYVRSLIQGLQQAAKQKVEFNWAPVLELANWVNSQPRAIEGREAKFGDSDPDWSWTRKALPDLLVEGFADSPVKLPCEHRGSVFSVLSELAEDPDPTPEDEQKAGGGNMDAATMSINTVRGGAFHTLIHFAFWVRRCINAAVFSEQSTEKSSFELMPEVREVLEKHLDLAVEPSLAIRSVYGKLLPYLANLDWDWSCANLSRIFTMREDEAAYFRAAWESFVVFCQPNTALLPELLPYYRQAAQQVGSTKDEKRHPANPDDSLGEHLIVYYWLDKLQLDGKDGLIEDFYSRATEQTRAHLMWFIGQSVSAWEESVPPLVFDRLRAFFEYRLEEAQQAPSPTGYAKELAGFGYWFTSGKFDEKWSLDTILKVLQLTGKVEFEHELTNRLTDISSRYPLDCVAACRLMIEGSKEPWIILDMGDGVKQILETALRSGFPDAVLAAKKLIEDLIAKGHFDFRKLLE